MILVTFFLHWWCGQIGGHSATYFSASTLAMPSQAPAEWWESPAKSFARLRLQTGWHANKNKHIFWDKRKIVTFFKTIKNFVFLFFIYKTLRAQGNIRRKIALMLHHEEGFSHPAVGSMRDGCLCTARPDGAKSAVYRPAPVPFWRAAGHSFSGHWVQ